MLVAPSARQRCSITKTGKWFKLLTLPLPISKCLQVSTMFASLTAGLIKNTKKQKVVQNVPVAHAHAITSCSGEGLFQSRDWRHFRSGPVTWLPVDPWHGSTANVTLSVLIYYLGHLIFLLLIHSISLPFHILFINKFCFLFVFFFVYIPYGSLCDI